MLNEKGLCKVLKTQHKRGYEIATKKDRMTIYGKSWAVQCDVVDLPKKASVQIVENVGHLPIDPVRVQAGELNQSIMEDAISIKTDVFDSESDQTIRMTKIPVIYRERWQLYQTENGEIYGFDTELLEIIDFRDFEPTVMERMTVSGGMGIWTFSDTAVFIAPGRFSALDRTRIRHIAALDWTGNRTGGDPCANMSLFDENEDVPPIEREG